MEGRLDLISTDFWKKMRKKGIRNLLVPVGTVRYGYG